MIINFCMQGYSLIIFMKQTIFLLVICLILHGCGLKKPLVLEQTTPDYNTVK